MEHSENDLAIKLIQCCDYDDEFDEGLKEAARLVLETVSREELNVEAWGFFIVACGRSSMVKKCDVSIENFASVTMQSLAPAIGITSMREGALKNHRFAELMDREVNFLKFWVDALVISETFIEYRPLLENLKDDIMKLGEALK